jgi:hypothetical protein
VQVAALPLGGRVEIEAVALMCVDDNNGESNCRG